MTENLLLYSDFRFGKVTNVNLYARYVSVSEDHDYVGMEQRFSALSLINSCSSSSWDENYTLLMQYK